MEQVSLDDFNNHNGARRETITRRPYPEQHQIKYEIEVTNNE